MCRFHHALNNHRVDLFASATLSTDDSGIEIDTGGTSVLELQWIAHNLQTQTQPFVLFRDTTFPKAFNVTVGPSRPKLLSWMRVVSYNVSSLEKAVTNQMSSTINIPWILITQSKTKDFDPGVFVA